MLGPVLRLGWLRQMHILKLNLWLMSAKSLRHYIAADPAFRVRVLCLKGSYRLVAAGMCFGTNIIEA